METTQKNREEAAQRRPRQEVQEGRPQAARQDAAPPPSAQQNNGAARTAEEQRSTAARNHSQQETQPRKKQAEPVKKSAAKKPSAKKTAAKKPAAKQGTAEKKRPSSPKKAVPQKKKAAPKADLDDISTKKRAYGNSKPKKKSAAAAIGDMFRKDPEKTGEKNAKQGKKAKAARPKQPTPAVIYTQPAAFNRNRLLMQLVTVTAIVLALVMGLSVFFKVEHITVSGAEVYSEWAIKEASGLVEGEDNLLTFSRPRAGALIKANLPYVDTVRFGIKLPDTVNIIVEEDDVVYAIKDQNGAWWMINSNGRVVEMGNNSKAANNTQVLGVELDNPVADEKGIAVETVSTETMEGGELIPITTTGAQRLTAALQILRALEENGIVGEVASVDLTRLEDIILWYGTRYQVNLGDSTNLEYKIACLNDVILQMNEWQSGILDISFTIWPNQVGYTPFA